MSFQKYEVHKNYDLMLYRTKPKNAGFEQSALSQDKDKPTYFPKTYYKYNGKFYVQDKSVLEYNHSIVYKKLICTDNELDTVIFYDKKTFDTSVERVRSFRRPKNNNSETKNKVQHTSKKAIVVKQERMLSDNDIERMFELC